MASGGHKVRLGNSAESGADKSASWMENPGTAEPACLENPGRLYPEKFSSSYPEPKHTGNCQLKC